MATLHWCLSPPRSSDSLQTWISMKVHQDRSFQKPIQGRVASWPCAAVTTSCLSSSGLPANRTDSRRNTLGYRIPGLARPPMPNYSIAETENQTESLLQVLQRHGLGGQTQSQLYPLAICNFVSYLNMNLNFHIYKIKSQTFTKDTAWCFVIKTVGFAVTA